MPAAEAVAVLLGLDCVSAALAGPLRASSGEAVEWGEGSGSNRDRTKWDAARSSERELHRRGVPVHVVPALENAAPVWMRGCIRIAQDLLIGGYEESSGNDGQQTKIFFESHPSGCFAALLGRLPFGRNTLEGRLQRQLALIRERVDLPDPLEAMEELTAHHLLAGRLPLEGLCHPWELDAAAGAFTAWLAWNFPARVEWLGSEKECRICLPIAKARV